MRAILSAMIAPERVALISREDLLTLVAALQRQVAELTASNEALRAELEQLTRGGKRQAAPFSKGTPLAEPQSPGRKPGSGTFRYREAPPPEAITEPPVDVKVTLDACPACGGPLEEERVDLAYRTELPHPPRPKVMQYRVWVCRCTVCGSQVRGQHPDLAPEQHGASAHRLGERVMAAAHALHYGVGIPVRKVPAVLAALTGVRLTQGALTQDALKRTAGPVGMAYEPWRAAVSGSPVVHTDDTGWRVGGQPAYLMAFETEAATVYQIRPRHRHEEVQEVIPVDYAGVMVTDRGAATMPRRSTTSASKNAWPISSARSATCWRPRPAGRATSGRGSRRCCRRRCSSGTPTGRARCQTFRPKPRPCKRRSRTSCATGG
jgi:transposase